MSDTTEQESVDFRGISRRDFLKVCSLLGGVALHNFFTNTIDVVYANSNGDTFTSATYFQWQNEFLCKTIYPMREHKLRDVLIYYMEVDVWSQYKDKDVSTLKDELYEYKKAWELNAVEALQNYNRLRDYFLTVDIRRYYSYNFFPVDEEALTDIENLHAFFRSFPKDIRNERNFLQNIITQNWEPRVKLIRNRIKYLTTRHAGMDPAHPKYISEGEKLKFLNSTTLPMVEYELSQLRAFDATYDKIEERKLAWYTFFKNDPNFKISEAVFVVTFPPEKQVTIRDIAYWKVDEYTKSIAEKNQYELLDLIHQKFQKEPERYPSWLQYMIVHFSGMRYASAHGSWADAKDLMVRLRALKIEQKISAFDDAMVEKLCLEKVTTYETPVGDSKPKLAGAQEKEWQDAIRRHMLNIKSENPFWRRQGLLELSKAEVAYEILGMSTQKILKTLLAIKSTFSSWAWKEIVKLTPLRVTEVSDLDWETLTPEETEERDEEQSRDIRGVISAWKRRDPTAWRDEHGRTLELIVTRLVCNETAEHCQHVRGNLPPGGLAAKPKWYVNTESNLMGAYFVKPTSEKDYTQGASILWLRFVNFSTSNPNEWQIARWIETKQKVGLLPAEFINNGKTGGWIYKFDAEITRSRTKTIGNQQVAERQWLRWIHEATVAEVAETADGMVVLTFETGLPGGDQASSAVGMFKNTLKWHLSDGTEDQYNRSFVGYIPEGQTPTDQLKTTLDWNMIFRK